MPINSPQKVPKVRRDYNQWVATETLEDYALRFAPKSFRKWSEFRVANTAIGGISFLALEAIGGSLCISYGFANSFRAIVVVGIVIFLAGMPICYYASKYNIDMDLLTRGAGFGYMGSTITSLIYACFTFIFFALEAAIMAQALEIYFHLSLPIGYVVCSLIIIPLVFFGITLISQLQLWTQPLWVTLMLMPYIFVLYKEPDALLNWFNFAGISASGAAFEPLLFGAAASVSFSLIGQLGEQVDYLRFLPDKQEGNRKQWWLALILAGPGWIILGTAKQLGGAFLASLAISHGVSLAKATEPIQMYLAGFEYVFSNPAMVLGVGTLFVLISQIKINVTNAYAGSLAWSNFFSRMTHSHPGRVVWLIFNIVIALILMELGVFQTLKAVLGLYSNVAIAWIATIVADLAINKPLGLSPSYIEFKRAHLYNINPVGFGSMLIASVLSSVAYAGWLGPIAQAYCSFIALSCAFVLVPLIAFLTKGKYYIARENIYFTDNQSIRTMNCNICEISYELDDLAFCPVYDGPICSLCCSLDARCHDRCKKESVVFSPQSALDLFLENLSSQILPLLGSRVFKFLGIFLIFSGGVGVLFWIVYYQQILSTSATTLNLSESLSTTLLKLYASLVILNGIGTWWLVLSEESRQLAEEEIEKQNLQLQQEILERLQAEKALRLSEEQMRHEALHDSLTGLANRALLIERLGQAIKRHQRLTDKLFAVMFLDLDRFKVINDSLGHQVGDRLLISLAQRLEKCQRASDTLARLGGDEFVILLEDLNTVDEAIKVAERIHQILASPFLLDSKEIFVSASIGIAPSSPHYSQPGQLLRDADTAMYHAKARGKACQVVFDSSMRTLALKQLHLESDLAGALERQELVLFYQPIVSLENNSPQGFEALVRWQHPERGLISPNEFIPLAEETGLILELDQWVLSTACQQMHLWRQQFPSLASLTLSVNLSGKQFAQPDLSEKLELILSETNLERRYLKLEITESALIENAESAAEMLWQLQAKGIQVCLDDFGTGYSSLSYLNRFPINILKIDRSFINALGAQGNSAAIVRIMLTLAEEMGLKSIAEGVETNEQKKLLQAWGCQYAQGYLFLPPVDSQGIETFLRTLSCNKR